MKLTVGLITARRTAKGAGNKERVYRLLLEERLTAREIAKKTGICQSSVNDYLCRLAAVNRVYVVCKRKGANCCPEKVWSARYASYSAQQRPASIEFAGPKVIRGYMWTGGDLW